MRSKDEILDEMKIFPIPHDGVDITGIAEALLDIRDALVRMGPSDYAFEQNRLMEEDMRTSRIANKAGSRSFQSRKEERGLNST